MLRHLITLFLSCSGVTSELLNLSEGSKCSRNGISGKCVNAYNCLSSYHDFVLQDYAPICSFRGKEPFICCTDCTFVDTRNSEYRYNLLTYLNQTYLRKTGQKAQDKCIEYLEMLNFSCKSSYYVKITKLYKPDTNCNEVNMSVRGFAVSPAGGTDTSRGDFPHMGLLGYGGNTTTAEWVCGGTVISERFILTAGHCMSSPTLGPVKYVALGILKRSDPPELWQIYNVKRRIPHPEYKPPSKYNDIALLETDTEIIFSLFDVKPACLHATGETEEKLFATGWGSLGYRRELSDTLQEVEVTRYEKDDCSKYYPTHRLLKNGYNHTTQMCYGDKNVLRDTCEGDSGGPLQESVSKIYSDSVYCFKTVVGVTSYGRRCGMSNRPGMYTRVIHYVPWIESIVWP